MLRLQPFVGMMMMMMVTKLFGTRVIVDCDWQIPSNVSKLCVLGGWMGDRGGINRACNYIRVDLSIGSDLLYCCFSLNLFGPIRAFTGCITSAAFQDTTEDIFTLLIDCIDDVQ